MVETDVCIRIAKVCSATLTIVVSKTTAIAPTMRMKAFFRTFGSIFSAMTVSK